MQLFSIRQPFDGGDALSIGFNGQAGAGINRLLLHDDRTGTATPPVAESLRPGQSQFVSKDFQQGPVGFYLQAMHLAVDVELDHGLLNP